MGSLDKYHSRMGLAVAIVHQRTGTHHPVGKRTPKRRLQHWHRATRQILFSDNLLLQLCISVQTSSSGCGALWVLVTSEVGSKVQLSLVATPSSILPPRPSLSAGVE